jgi:hypothetical protein
MNIWDDAWGEQEKDWSGGGGRSKRLVPRGPLRRRGGPRISPEVVEYPDLKRLTARSTHGLFVTHDVKEDA